MFEAKLVDGSILKRIVEAIKDVVNDVNIDVSPSGKYPELSSGFDCKPKIVPSCDHFWRYVPPPIMTSKICAQIILLFPK